MTTDNIKNDSIGIKPFKLSDLEEMTLDNLSNEDLFLVSDAIDNNKRGGGSYISKKIKFQTVGDYMYQEIYKPLDARVANAETKTADVEKLAKVASEDAKKAATNAADAKKSADAAVVMAQDAKKAADGAAYDVKVESAERQKADDQLAADIKTTQAQFSDVEKQIADVQAAATNAQKTADDASASAAAAKKAADLAEKNIADEAVRAKGAEAVIQANVDGIKASVTEMQGKVAGLDESVKDISVKVEKNSNDIEAANGRTTALEEMLVDYTEVEAQVGANKAGIEACAAKLVDVEAKAQAAEDKANNAVTTAETAHAKADEVGAELNDLSEATVMHTDGIISSGYVFADDAYGQSVEGTACSVAIAQKLHLEAGEGSSLSVCNVAWPWKPGTGDQVIATTTDISSELSTRFKKVTESEWSTISADADDSTFYFIIG